MKLLQKIDAVFYDTYYLHFALFQKNILPWLCRKQREAIFTHSKKTDNVKLAEENYKNVRTKDKSKSRFHQIRDGATGSQLLQNILRSTAQFARLLSCACCLLYLFSGWSASLAEIPASGMKLDYSRRLLPACPVPDQCWAGVAGPAFIRSIHAQILVLPQTCDRAITDVAIPWNALSSASVMSAFLRCSWVRHSIFLPI